MTRRWIVTIGMTLALPGATSAQSIALSTGIVIPAGESRDVSDAAQDVVATLTVPTRWPVVTARLDAAFWRSLSHVIPGAVAQTLAFSLGTNLSSPRIPIVYGIAGAGAYRSSMWRSPVRVRATIDVGFNGGLGAQWAPHPRLRVFVESRLHHVLTTVRPTDFLDVSGGLSISR